MLTLYDYYRSSAAFRVRIALNLKNVEYKKVPIDLSKNGGEQFSAEYSEINPQHLVPALVDDKKIITQSLAIMEYLEERFPKPAIFPKELYPKTLARSMALIIVAEVHPLNNLRVRKYLSDVLKLSEQQSQAWYQHWIEKGLSAFEKQLEISAFVGQFCFGDTPTIADICLVPQVYNAVRFHCDLKNYPIIQRIDAACQTHPAFKKAWPNEGG